MIVFPVIAMAVSALFSAALLRRHPKSKKVHLLAWGVSLSMFALASGALALAQAFGWGPWNYRFFWLFGAVLNVPWLALGSVSLAFPRISKLGLAAMLFVSVYLTLAVVAADPSALVLVAEEGIPRGKDVWPEGSNMLRFVRYASIGGWLVVVGLAAWTSRSRRGVTPSRERIRGNSLIAVGVSIVAVGGFILGRIGGAAAFSLSLAVGVVTMYAGFLAASKAPRYQVTDPGEQAT